MVVETPKSFSFNRKCVNFVVIWVFNEKQMFAGIQMSEIRYRKLIKTFQFPREIDFFREHFKSDTSANGFFALELFRFVISFSRPFHLYSQFPFNFAFYWSHFWSRNCPLHASKVRLSLNFLSIQFFIYSLSLCSTFSAQIAALFLLFVQHFHSLLWVPLSA